MTTLLRCNSDNKDFQLLVRELDRDLAHRNGDSNDFFAAFNKTDMIKHAVVIFYDSVPVACGAMKAYNAETMEVKRMFVPAEFRGKGYACSVLKELEQWASELGFKKFVLETGIKMPEAIGLYKKYGFRQIPNYGQYEQVESSVCFEKLLQ